MSTFPILAAMAEEIREGRLPADARIGALVARTFGLHHMSRAVSEALGRGDDAELGASVVKVLGTKAEGDIATSSRNWPANRRQAANGSPNWSVPA